MNDNNSEASARSIVCTHACAWTKLPTGEADEYRAELEAFRELSHYEGDRADKGMRVTQLLPPLGRAVERILAANREEWETQCTECVTPRRGTCQRISGKNNVCSQTCTPQSKSCGIQKESLFDPMNCYANPWLKNSHSSDGNLVSLCFFASPRGSRKPTFFLFQPWTPSHH